jgi:hypothetical protein
MKNINYDLVKLLHHSLDEAWKLEKFYLKDAKKSTCNCSKVLKRLLDDNQKHIAMLREEIEHHSRLKKFE